MPGDPGAMMSPNGTSPGQQQTSPDGQAFFPPGGGPPGGPDGAPPAEKKTIRRVGAKPPPDRAPRSIYCFSVKNPLRKRLIELGCNLRQSCFSFYSQLQFHLSKVILIQ